MKDVGFDHARVVGLGRCEENKIARPIADRSLGVLKKTTYGCTRNVTEIDVPP